MASIIPNRYILHILLNLFRKPDTPLQLLFTSGAYNSKVEQATFRKQAAFPVITNISLNHYRVLQHRYLRETSVVTRTSTSNQ